MKLRRYFYILLSLLFFDLVFNLFTYEYYLRSSVINIFLFDLINAALISIVISLFNKRINKIITYVIYGFLWFWYSLYYVFYRVLITPFSIALLRQSDQVLKSYKQLLMSIFENLYIILIFLLPLILLLIFRKKINYSVENKKSIGILVGMFIIFVGIYFGNMFIQKKDLGSIYSLYYNENNVSLNIERLGVMSATYLDIKRAIFGINEKITNVSILDDDDNEFFEYDYNYDNTLNFEGGNSDISIINNYVKNENGTKQNKYTGMFEEKNLIFIVAESFSEIAVSEEYTPTLYKLVHDGFYFKNFYTSNNLSTIGGEFQALTGLYADNTILSSWRNGTRYYPYGLGNVFKNNGYNIFAYHDNSVYFQDRNIYLKTQGFNNFKGCYNGLENDINCEQWPQSDVEMINATINDYINSDKLFMTYYMTVSGHFYYNFNDNAIANKNKDLVKDLDYSEEVKGYIATQMELDRALELLVSKLKESGKLDDTVIVLLADHFPYNLSIDNINSLSTYKRDYLIEANSNNLVIYNSKMKKVTVDKVGMSIDVLPTVLNLFGIKYDSRIIMGKDILSTTPGIAIFKDRSWVTNKGTYYASTGKFESNDNSIGEDYVKDINTIVNNRVAISRMIVDNNYYKYLFKQ